MNDFGKNLKKYRALKGFTQAGLAEATGYSQNAISKMESGGAERPRKLDKLARALGVSESELLFGEDDGQRGALQVSEPSTKYGIGLAPIDNVLLLNVMKVLDQSCDPLNFTPTAEQWAKMAGFVYNETVKVGGGVDDIPPRAVVTAIRDVIS